MKKTNIFSDSAGNLKKTRCIAAMAMLIAVYIAADQFSLQITPELRLGFSFIANALVGLLFGPVAAMLSGAATDVIVAVITPRGPYFPGYTLTAIVSGLLYGLVLYNKKVTYPRALLAKGLVNVIGNIVLNTIWISITGGKALFVLLPARVLKNLAMLPIEALLLYLLGGALSRFLPGLFAPADQPAPKSPSKPSK